MLDDLSDVDKKLIVDTGKLHVLEPMKPIYKKGDPPKSFYLIKQGHVKIWREDGDSESILAFVKDNDFFGDLELVGGQPRAANVTTMERVEIVEVPRGVFAGLFQRGKIHVGRRVRDLLAKEQFAQRLAPQRR